MRCQEVQHSQEIVAVCHLKLFEELGIVLPRLGGVVRQVSCGKVDALLFARSWHDPLSGVEVETEAVGTILETIKGCFFLNLGLRQEVCVRLVIK